MDFKNPKRSLFVPQEIIEEILSKLTVKPLLKFRCVSKPWRALIDSKRFVKTHLQNSIAFSHPMVIINYRDELKQSYESGDPSPFDDLINNLLKSPRIVGCCNGLVCIYEISLGCFFLWNPSTRIFKKLPQVHREIKNNWYVLHHEFGWDESSDDYIVKAYVLVPNQLIGKAYSLKTDSWETLMTMEFLPDLEDRDLLGSMREDSFVYSNSNFESFPREYLYIESLVSAQI